jgi:8-amino-7-oxononanoate synthase
VNGFEAFLNQELCRLEAHHLRRQLRTVQSLPRQRVATPQGVLVQFSSNDYLGLAQHPMIRAAAAEGASAGAGAGAARLVSGTFEAHASLERVLAEFKGAERALTFTSGYAAALGVIPALVGPGDCVVLDRLSHACLVDAARLSGARLRVFRHNDVEDLDRILRWAGEARRRGFRRAAGAMAMAGEGMTGGQGEGRVLIVTESVFSMDGDRAPLREIVDCKDRHGAWLMVDEAHATGMAGAGRRGVIEELGLEGRVEVPMGTLGKALGSAGGFVTGSAALIEFLVNRARSFVFSTAPPPAVAAAAMAAVGVVRAATGAELVARLHANVDALHRGLAGQGWTLPPPVSPILPLHIGEEDAAVRVAGALRDEGFLVPAIRYPTVARGRARLRVTVSAAHEAEDLAAFLCALPKALARTGLRPA